MHQGFDVESYLLQIIITFKILTYMPNMNIHIIPKSFTASEILAKKKEPYTGAYDSFLQRPQLFHWPRLVEVVHNGLPPDAHKVRRHLVFRHINLMSLVCHLSGPIIKPLIIKLPRGVTLGASIWWVTVDKGLFWYRDPLVVARVRGFIPGTKRVRR